SSPVSNLVSKITNFQAFQIYGAIAEPQMINALCILHEFMGSLKIFIPSVFDVLVHHLDVLDAYIHHPSVHHTVVWASSLPFFPRKIAQPSMQVDYWDAFQHRCTFRFRLSIFVLQRCTEEMLQ